MPFRSMRLYARVLCLCAPAAFAQTIPTPPVAFPTGMATPLGQQIAALTAEPAVVRAHWGIAVTTLDGTPIYGLNEAEFFRPASNAKLFTTAAAMQLLGPELRLSTHATASAPLSADGILHGDIVLFGQGDANISNRHIPYENAAQRKQRLESSPEPPGANILILKMVKMASDLAMKIKEIDGDIVGDDTLWPYEPYANDWAIDDAIWGYGAPVSALTINDNQLELLITPGRKPGDKATASLSPAVQLTIHATGATWPGGKADVVKDPEVPYYTLDDKITTVGPKQPASIRIDREPGSKIIRIVGSVAIGEPYTTEIAIQDPAEYAAVVLKYMLELDGVKVTGTARAKHRLSNDTADFSDESRTPLVLSNTSRGYGIMGVGGANVPVTATLVSPTPAEDIVVTLKVSQNLHAELLLRRLGKKYGSDGSTAQGARVVRQFLINAGLDGDDFVFFDGSGLSGHDLVTPRATAQLLAYASHQPWFAQWRTGFPIGGEDGTLAKRFPEPPLKDHLFAKTGTLSEARALSGYVDCTSGKTVIFSVMVDNHAPNTPADRDVMDRIVAAIAANN